jgi:hypothetical protein
MGLLHRYDGALTLWLVTFTRSTVVHVRTAEVRTGAQGGTRCCWYVRRWQCYTFRSPRWRRASTCRPRMTCCTTPSSPPSTILSSLAWCLAPSGVRRHHVGPRTHIVRARASRHSERAEEVSFRADDLPHPPPSPPDVVWSRGHRPSHPGVLLRSRRDHRTAAGGAPAAHRQKKPVQSAG